MAAANTQAPATENKEQVLDKKRLYVRWDVTDDTFKDAFAKFGNLVDARVVRNVRIRNFGFVTFETEQAAAAALAALSNKTLTTSPLTIEFASGDRQARPKREPRAKAAPAQGGQLQSAQQGNQQGGAQEQGAGRGRARRGGRGRRGRGRNADGAPAQGGAQGQGQANQQVDRAQARAEAQARAAAREAENAKNPNWGKIVQLTPDPIATPLPKDAQLQELLAGQRFYRKDRSDAKVVGSLMLNADPSRGGFSCNFKIGDFQLKLLSVNVVSKPGDTRVGCRVEHPEGKRSREVYFRTRANGHNSHKFLELRKPRALDAQGNEIIPEGPYDVFFVTIDSITLDVNTGLWKKLLLSVVSLTIQPRAPRPAAPATAAATQQ